MLIDRALRDEGTSLHYLPPDPSGFAAAPAGPLLDAVEASLHAAGLAAAIHRGPTWSTDAPYRETAAAIAHAASCGVLAVEMEAAALYAFAQARGVSVTCFAHVTNTMGQQGGDDFEKGEADGSLTALGIIAAAAGAFTRMSTHED